MKTVKRNIAIIMGGYSDEYQISLKSGNVVYNTLLNSKKYKPYKIHIFKDRWVLLTEQHTEYAIDKADFSVTVENSKISFDGVFNAIHGSPGEDGLIQAYFNLIDLPLTGCSMYNAALTFNKRNLLAVLKPFGIQSAKSYYLNNGDTIDENKIIDAVGLPCFVKANSSGSSFGVYKVNDKAALKPAIDKAFKFDKELIIEAFLDGTEVTVGVISYKGETLVLPVTEIVSENEFFDFEAKYKGKSQEITPARINNTLTEKVSQTAKRIYHLLGMKGFSRSEFIFKDNQPYLLEMNTVPGLTNESILPKQAAAANISLLSLFENAIEEVIG